MAYQIKPEILQDLKRIAVDISDASAKLKQLRPLITRQNMVRMDDIIDHYDTEVVTPIISACRNLTEADSRIDDVLQVLEPKKPEREDMKDAS